MNGSEVGGGGDSLLSASSSVWLLDFRDTYTGYVHGYLAIVVCVFGILTNLVNIVVLTRKEMATATNAILTGLAVADLLVMASYVPFAFHHYVDHSTSSSSSANVSASAATSAAASDSMTLQARFSYRWTLFTLVHAHVTVVGHAVSTWLTVLLAVWRYLSVRFPTESRNWLTMGAAKWAILATYLAVPVLCIPVYVSFNIYRKGGPGGGDDGSDYYYYVVNFSQVSLRNNQLLKRVNFWLFSVFLKIVPCILLTFLSKALISALLEAERRKRRLKTQTCFSLTATSAASTGGQGVRPSGAAPSTTTATTDRTPNDRTTRMLLAVLLIFLVTEFPPGLLSLCSGLLGETFFSQVHQPLGEILDILALVNSAINFLLYCTMSKQFRLTFSKLFFL